MRSEDVTWRIMARIDIPLAVPCLPALPPASWPTFFEAWFAAPASAFTLHYVGAAQILAEHPHRDKKRASSSFVGCNSLYMVQLALKGCGALLASRFSWLRTINFGGYSPSALNAQHPTVQRCRQPRKSRRRPLRSHFPDSERNTVYVFQA